MEKTVELEDSMAVMKDYAKLVGHLEYSLSTPDHSCTILCHYKHALHFDFSWRSDDNELLRQDQASFCTVCEDVGSNLTGPQVLGDVQNCGNRSYYYENVYEIHELLRVFKKF